MSMHWDWNWKDEYDRCVCMCSINRSPCQLPLDSLTCLLCRAGASSRPRMQSHSIGMGPVRPYNTAVDSTVFPSVKKIYHETGSKYNKAMYNLKTWIGFSRTREMSRVETTFLQRAHLLYIFN